MHCKVSLNLWKVIQNLHEEILLLSWMRMRVVKPKKFLEHFLLSLVQILKNMNCAFAQLSLVVWLIVALNLQAQMWARDTDLRILIDLWGEKLKDTLTTVYLLVQSENLQSRQDDCQYKVNLWQLFEKLETKQNKAACWFCWASFEELYHGVGMRFHFILPARSLSTNPRSSRWFTSQC